MKITVSQEIIDEGCELKTHGDPSNCPIATAVWRRFSQEYIKVVDHGSERVGYGKPRVSVTLYDQEESFPFRIRNERRFEAGRSAHRFIRKFDREKHVEPFTFILKEVS